MQSTDNSQWNAVNSIRDRIQICVGKPLWIWHPNALTSQPLWLKTQQHFSATDFTATNALSTHSHSLATCLPLSSSIFFCPLVSASCSKTLHLVKRSMNCTLNTLTFSFHVSEKSAWPPHKRMYRQTSKIQTHIQMGLQAHLSEGNRPSLSS